MNSLYIKEIRCFVRQFPQGQVGHMKVVWLTEEELLEEAKKYSSEDFILSRTRFRKVRSK